VNAVVCARAMSAPVEQLTIEQVRAFDPSNGLDAVVNVTCSAGRIETIGPATNTRSLGAANPGAANPGAANPGVVNGAGCWLLPSFVDLRARVGQPGFEYRETVASGLSAAAAGGFGAVCTLPDSAPPADEAVVVQALLKEANHVAKGELLPIAAATRRLRGQELAEFGALQQAGAVAIGDADGFSGSALLLRRVFEYAQTFNLLVLQHPSEASLTDGTVMHEGAVSARLGLRGNPDIAEQIAVERDLAFVRLTGARYHASALSSAASVQAIARAKAEGLKVSADTAVMNLVGTDADVGIYNATYRALPPLRTAAAASALLRAVEDGTIDAVCSNHAPVSALEKSGEFDQAAAGINTLELCFSLLLSLHERGELSLTSLVRALSSSPARVLGRTQPSLKIGASADFVLVDPAARWVPSARKLFSKSHNTPFLEQELRGKVLLTVHQGRVIFKAT
jgi:dihydroorotase